MPTTHLRFCRKTPGHVRKGEIRNLLSLGVVSMKPAFPPDTHPDRSCAYAITLARGADPAALEAYLAESTNLIAMDAAALADLAVAPFPEPPKAPATKFVED